MKMYIIIGLRSINNGVELNLNIKDNENFNLIVCGLFWLNNIIFSDLTYFIDIEKEVY